MKNKLLLICIFIAFPFLKTQAQIKLALSQGRTLNIDAKKIYQTLNNDEEQYIKETSDTLYFYKYFPTLRRADEIRIPLVFLNKTNTRKWGASVRLMNRTWYFVVIKSATPKDAFSDYPNTFKVFHHGYEEAPPMNDYQRQALIYFMTESEAKNFLKNLQNNIKKFN